MKDGSFLAIPLGASDPRALPSYAVQYADCQLTAVEMQQMALYGPNPTRTLTPSLVCGFTATIPIWKIAFQVIRFCFPRVLVY